MCWLPSERRAAPHADPIANFKWSQFYRAFLACYTALASFDFVAEVFSVFFRNPLIGMLM